MKTFRLKCEILSPVHIGSGSQIDPLNYIIRGKSLYALSFEKFVTSMNEADRTRFEALIDLGDLGEIRKFVLKNINTEKDSLYSVEVSPQVTSLYKSKIGDIQNQLLISPFIRTEGGVKALVPGTSIKGAIRTAVISELAKHSKLPNPKGFKEEYEFESKVLGYKDEKKDPFRGLKIRDNTLESGSTIIREVRNVSKKSGGVLGSNNIQIICEVCHSFITGKPIYLETEISFDELLFSTRFLSKPITKEQVIRSCTEFYRSKMEDEHRKFYKDSVAEKYSMQLLDTPLETNSFFLRVGRFSGVESVTLDKYRNPRSPGNKTVWGTTRNLVEGKYPMGWVKATICE